MMKMPIYLDYSATSPVDPRVAERMSRCLLTDGAFGNPASRSHAFGWQAEELVEEARQHVADLLNCDPREIVFTSGGTESDNLAIKGIAEAHGDSRALGRLRHHIVTSSIEHKAVLDTCHYLETKGFSVTYLAPTRRGWIDPESVAAAVRDDTLLITIMHANNEIGVINDIAAIGAVARARNVFFHTDAAQSVGKVPIDLSILPVDLLSISAHKIYGPKGIGALYVRRSPQVTLATQMHGGGHERGFRSGTLPTHQIVGLGEACRICHETLTQESTRMRALRDRLWRGIAQLEGVSVNGDLDQRLPGNLNVSFAGVDGEVLIAALDDIAVSSGSACTSATVEPSYVLKAIGLSDELAHAALRITVGRFTTEAEVDQAARRVCEVVNRLREFESKPA